jgi:hypothetical protein
MWSVVENLEKLIIDLKNSLERKLHVVQEGITPLRHPSGTP